MRAVSRDGRAPVCDNAESVALCGKEGSLASKRSVFCSCAVCAWWRSGCLVVRVAGLRAAPACSAPCACRRYHVVPAGSQCGALCRAPLRGSYAISRAPLSGVC